MHSARDSHCDSAAEGLGTPAAIAAAASGGGLFEVALPEGLEAWLAPLLLLLLLVAAAACCCFCLLLAAAAAAAAAAPAHLS